MKTSSGLPPPPPPPLHAEATLDPTAAARSAPRTSRAASNDHARDSLLWLLIVLPVLTRKNERRAHLVVLSQKQTEYQHRTSLPHRGVAARQVIDYTRQDFV
jgi:hypothetical protein